MTKRSQKMSDEDLRRALDYSVGDIVQIISGDAAGRVAVVIGIAPYTNANGEDCFIYNLKLSDNESISAKKYCIRFVRHGDGA